MIQEDCIGAWSSIFLTSWSKDHILSCKDLGHWPSLLSTCRRCFCPMIVEKRASQVVLGVKNLPANAGDMRHETWSLGGGRYPGREHGKPRQYSCLENPWTEEHGGLQLQRVGHDCSNWACRQKQTITYRMDKQEGPIIYHRKLNAIFCDKPQWKIMNKNAYVCVYLYNWTTAVQQKLTQYCKSTILQFLKSFSHNFIFIRSSNSICSK